MTTEHSNAYRIRSLLERAHDALLGGDTDRAERLSQAARSTASALHLPRIYVGYYKTCPNIRTRQFQETAQLPQLCNSTPEQEVASCRARATASNPFDASSLLVMGHIATGAFTDRGALVLIPDWTDTHEASKI